MTYLGFTAVHGGLSELLPQLELDLTRLERGGRLHGVGAGLEGEGDGGLDGVAHLAHHHSDAWNVMKKKLRYRKNFEF